MVFSPVLYAMTYRTCRMSAEAAVVRGALSRCVCRNILILSDVVRYCRLSVRRIQSSMFRHTQQRRSHASLGLLIVPHRVVHALTCVIRQMRHALLSRVMMCFLMYVRTRAPQHLNWHCRCVAACLETIGAIQPSTSAYAATYNNPVAVVCRSGVSDKTGKATERNSVRPVAALRGGGLGQTPAADLDRPAPRVHARARTAGHRAVAELGD